MRVHKGKKYYSAVEVAELLETNTATIYYYTKSSKHKNFPDPTVVNNSIHWSEDDVETIREFLDNRDTTRGRKREENYTPIPQSSYSKLKMENLEYRREIVELKEELRFWKRMAGGEKCE